MKKQDLVTGLYSIASPNRKKGFQCAVILDLDFAGIHVSLLNELFDKRPRAVPTGVLSCGMVEVAKDGREIVTLGHVPVTHRLFLSWKPRLLEAKKIHPGDLKELRKWRRKSKTVQAYFDEPFWGLGIPFIRPEESEEGKTLTIQSLWAT